MSAVLVVAAVLSCKHKQSVSKNDSHLAALLSPVEFEGFRVVGPISANRVDQLFREQVKIGSVDPDAYNFLVRDEGQAQKRLQVHTVAEYLEARAAGAYPYNTFDISMDSFFVRTASALVFLKQSKPAETNFLRLTSLLNLSVSFLDVPDREDVVQPAPNNMNSLRLEDYARSHKIRDVKQTSPIELRFTNGDMDYDCELVAGGDFDHDGIQDGLLFVSAMHHEGSGRNYSVYLISRKNQASETTVQDFAFWH